MVPDIEFIDFGNVLIWKILRTGKGGGNASKEGRREKGLDYLLGLHTLTCCSNF